MNKKEIIESAKAVLRSNDSGKFTRPAPGLYPHQWLWDSAFIAIGIARYDPQRAAQEIYSLLEGQWKNGMIPHMIFSAASENESARGHKTGSRFWHSARSPFAPDHKDTSGITQPPVIAEAVLKISQQMNKTESTAFLKRVYPALVDYHSWLYRERDPDGNGVVALFHPWETGLDNTPQWMKELMYVHTPLWIRFIDFARLGKVFEKVFRRDTQYVKAEERMSTADALRLTHIALGLRKRNYDSVAILRRPHLVIESLSFNSILVGNNSHLETIANKINQPLPPYLVEKFALAKEGLNSLWSSEHEQFCHRNHMTSQLVPVSGVSMLTPLYSGAISKKLAAKLVAQMHDPESFGLPYPVPSVPHNSIYFNPRKYWQGPTWINTNWLLIEGLKKYGYHKEAKQLSTKCLELYEKSGSFEYFSPLDGAGAGTPDFSWTAALIIDLASNK